MRLAHYRRQSRPPRQLAPRDDDGVSELDQSSPASPLGCTADLDGDDILETLLTEDQRGDTRDIDFPGVGNESPDHSCDVGAFELE